MNEKLIKFLNEKIAEIEKEYSVKGIKDSKLDRYFFPIVSVAEKTADGEELDRRIHNIFEQTMKSLYGYTDEQIHAFYKIYFYQAITNHCKCGFFKKEDIIKHKRCMKTHTKYRALIADKNFETFYFYDNESLGKVVEIADMQYYTDARRQFKKYTKGDPQYRKALELRERIAEDEFM